MSNSYWGYWLIVLGIFVIGVMMFSQDVTTTSTKDYYQLKEVANAAMVDAIDYSYFNQTGSIRIYKEIFVENFIRRFSETSNGTNTYQIDFFDLYESPPKVSIQISTNTAGYIIANQNSSEKIVNKINLILEYDPKSSSKSNCDYY